MSNDKWKMENGSRSFPKKEDFQMLTDGIMAFLHQAATEARTELPDRNSSLFLSGVLDSFTLVDFVTVLETECNIKIDDADLRPENFDTIAKVEAFISRARGAQ